MTRLALAFTKRASAQIVRADAWWRQHRAASAELLLDELSEDLTLLRGSPDVGLPSRHAKRADVRRVLLPRARFHVYYAVEREAVVVLALWSALRGHGPKL
jgi:hypothetical protein